MACRGTPHTRFARAATPSNTVPMRADRVESHEERSVMDDTIPVSTNTTPGRVASAADPVS